MDSTVHTQGMCIFFMPASAKKSFFAAHKIIRASIPQSSLSLQEFCIVQGVEGKVTSNSRLCR